MLSWVYPKMELVGTENLPEEPCVIVANHAQMNGPIACELNFPEKRYTWCAGEMMNWREVPAYAYRDFWSEKPKLLRPFYKLLSYLITPLAVPMYIAPKLRKLVLGKPIVFCALALIAEERRRICGYLMYKITRLACALPLHTVIPYRNIPKKDYPKNQIEEKQEL